MNTNKNFNDLKKHFSDKYTNEELEQKAEIVSKINKLKKEKNAVILGHNYMDPIIFHTITDIRGDSLELSRKAATTDKDIIVFCGVRFMAETAKILNPTKKVLLPAEAGCSLAESITGEDVRELKKRFPGVPVVTYVNTYADVKAESDICCTSGNAIEVVNSLDSEKIIFLPDEYLARNVAKETGKHIIFPTHTSSTNLQDSKIDYQMIGWQGRCEVHDQFSVQNIEEVRSMYPDVLILSHLECKPDVVAASDFGGSTKAMISYIQNTNAPQYLLLTESAMGENIAVANPGKNILRMCSIRCPHMNNITLEKTLESLTKEQIEINVPEEIRLRAYKAVERMIAIG